MTDTANGIPPTANGSGEPDGRTYWRSLGQLANTEDYQQYLHREFQEGASETPERVSRRGFLSVVAAAVAMASTTACRKPVRKILPYSKRPEDLVPGIPEYYATSLQFGGYGTGVLVKSSDGRPTKIEGNPLHPASMGGSSGLMQGELLNLYDPARSKHPRMAGEAAKWLAEDAPEEAPDFASAWKKLAAGLKGSSGEKLAILMPPTTSPTLLWILDSVTETYEKATIHTYTPVNRDNEIAGSKLAFGKALDPQYQLAAADVVVSFDSDFLGKDVCSVRYARDFASRRRPQDDADGLNRLYAVESELSVTGGQADHRFALQSGMVTDALFALAAELGVLKGELAKAVAPFEDHGLQQNGKNWVAAIAKDLLSKRGRGLVVAGPRQPAEAHAVAHAINAALGNVGTTVRYTATPPSMAVAQTESLRELTQKMDAGAVDVLLILGGNPVYDAPADLDFAGKLGKVGTAIHLGLHYDETAQACKWHLNAAHELEAWGDARAYDGTVSIVQPLVAPLYDGRSALEVLAMVAELDVTGGYENVSYNWSEEAGSDGFEQWWKRALQDGVVQGKAWPAVTPPDVRAGEVAKAVGARGKATPATAGSLEVTFGPDAFLHDGRFSNNPWMQECPDPVSKLTWDNAALMSMATADALGVSDGDVVALSAGGRSIEIPVWCVPPMADFSIALAFGYGRRLGEDHEVAKDAGNDVFPLRGSDSMHLLRGVKAQPTGRTYKLVSTQDHGSMEGRPLYRQSDVKHFKADPDFAPQMSPLAKTAALENERAREEAEKGEKSEEGHERVTERDLLKSLWTERDYSKGPQWGMVIDLNSCNGCNACVIACQSENNVPSVGKEHVSEGREMHWLRIDRYYYSGKGTEDPGIVHQPVPCMQCENAPCESVCPVAATTHSPDGLNDMVYNRCIGTRYCSNNCPYKVRRFNYFDFTKPLAADTMKMAQNPDVTVRSRGVMEKCTYCVQRINRTRRSAKVAGRDLVDGEIVPACGQTCPSQAITFGDITDPNSKVSKLRASSLNYAMLSERNLKPRTTYLAKVTNPNPELS